MQTPMLSLDDSNAQPSTPCSASIECGGRRSTLTALVAGDFCRRAFCKSGGGPPASVSRESIMRETRPKNLARRKQELFLNNHRLCTRRAGFYAKSGSKKNSVRRLLRLSLRFRFLWRAFLFRCRFCRGNRSGLCRGGFFAFLRGGLFCLGCSGGGVAPLPCAAVNGIASPCGKR